MAQVKPQSVAEAHREICESAKCEFKDRLKYYDPCARCPNGHWGQYIVCPEVAGLGDRVAAVAQPIARALDKFLGTDIQHCGSCEKRRQMLNKLTARRTV